MFEKEAEERAKDYTDNAKRQVAYECGFLDGVDLGYNKANEELEQKISVLLSCKNCPENKDGLICRKEYENKCLAQKIQFIKELQQENAELKARLNAINQLIPELEKENAELKGQVEMGYEVYNNNLDYSQHIEEQLTKAKEIIEELYNIIPASMADYAKEPMEHARKFMTEE